MHHRIRMDVIHRVLILCSKRSHPIFQCFSNATQFVDMSARLASMNATVVLRSLECNATIFALIVNKCQLNHCSTSERNELIVRRCATSRKIVSLPSVLIASSIA